MATHESTTPAFVAPHSTHLVERHIERLREAWEALQDRCRRLQFVLEHTGHHWWRRLSSACRRARRQLQSALTHLVVQQAELLDDIAQWELVLVNGSPVASRGIE